MTREKAKELLPIIKAYAEGKTIQVKRICGDWVDYEKEIIQFDNGEYRIKPEVTAGNKLRCFKCGKELNSDNMSNVMYTSNPPRYTCKDCEKQTDKYDETDYEPFRYCSDLVDFCGTKLIYVINKKYKTEMLIIGFDDEGLPPRVLLFGDMWVTLEELFENYTFCDGHPCGKHIYTEED